MKTNLQLLTKMLLVAAGLCVGANAWADGNKRSLYSQDYESAASTDWTCPDGTSTLETGDETYGKYAKCTSNTPNGDRSCYISVSYTAGSGCTTANMETAGYNIEFDILLQSGSYSARAEAQFIVTTTGPNLATNTKYTGTDYIFSLSQPTRNASSYSTTWYINDLDNSTGTTVELDNETWYHVKLTVTATSVSYSINGKDGVKTVESLPTIKGFWSLIGRGYDAAHCGIMQFDNLDIYDYSLLPQMTKTWSMDFKALSANVLNSASNTSTKVTKNASVSFSDAANHDFYTITNEGFNSNFGVTNTDWQVRYYGSTKEANTGLWPYNINSNRYMAIQNLKRNAWVAYSASDAVTASSNSVVSTATGISSGYVFQIPLAGVASFVPTVSSYIYSVDVYEPDNEVIGLLDKSGGYMSQFKSMSISEGEAINIHFKNRGKSDENAHNWAIRFYKTGVDFAFRADNWVNGENSSDYCNWNIDMDGNAINWETFKEQMQDAEVDMTVAYTGGGNFLITATSVCNSNTFHHSMNYKTALSDGLSLELGVDNSWIEVTSYEKANIYTATLTVNEGAISPVITIYSDAEKTEEATNGILYNGTYYYTAKLDGYADHEGSFTVSDSNPSISFTMTRMHSYTVKTFCGATDLEKTIKSDTDADGTTIEYYYPHYVLYDGDLYYIDKRTGSPQPPYFGNSFTLDEDNQIVKVDYKKSTTITDVVYLKEFEDIDGISKSISNTYTLTRASQGAIGYYSSKTAFASLEPGKYKIEVASYADNKTESQRIFTFSADDENIFTHIGNGYKVETSNEFTLYKTTNISVEYTNQHSSYGIDYVLIYKTGDATVSKTISTAGWSTYCSPYILDFSGDIDNLDAAYIVTGGSDGVLTKTQVTGAVPAGTGLLLKGTASASVEIPVAATAGFNVTANKLVGVTASETLTANGGYVLMTTPSLAFYKNSNDFTLSANSAYLPAGFDGADARSAFLLFGDESTGINAVQNVTVDGTYFNLAGQRISAPQKGLYIVNGKKVVVK